MLLHSKKILDGQMAKVFLPIVLNLLRAVFLKQSREVFFVFFLETYRRVMVVVKIIPQWIVFYVLRSKSQGEL